MKFDGKLADTEIGKYERQPTRADGGRFLEEEGVEGL
jgi:hypothetical protein